MGEYNNEHSRNIVDALVGGQGNAAIGQIAKQFGINDRQVCDVIGQLAPVLRQSMARNAQASGGLDALLGALKKGGNGKYLDDPSTLGDPSTRDDGNNILGHILGSKDVSHALAGKGAAQTGLSADIIKQILPLVASLAVGALNKQSANAPVGGNQISDLLGSMLNRNQDGSALDDLIGMAGSFFKR